MGCVVSTEHLLDQRLVLSPTVALRPEVFGALLYDYSSRRLTFVKDFGFAQVLRSLDGRSVAGVLDACGVDAQSRLHMTHALDRLVASGLVVTHGVPR